MSLSYVYHEHYSEILYFKMNLKSSLKLEFQVFIGVGPDWAA